MVTSTAGRRQRESRRRTLFLDFDGVLHPDEVYLVAGRPVLRMDGFGLFEWAGILDDLLAPYPDVQIVLSTTWVRLLGFDIARAYLPEPLQRRVVGATWHETDPRRWKQQTRYDQIRQSVERHRHLHWLAIVDDDTGWPDEHRANLALTDSLLGLGVASAQANLREKLDVLHR